MVIVQGHRGCDVVAVGEQVGLLRECLDLEFRAGHLPFQYSLERVIDDFVLFCMLIGNDFLPRERPSAHRPFGGFLRRAVRCQPLTTCCPLLCSFASTASFNPRSAARSVLYSV